MNKLSETRIDIRRIAGFSKKKKNVCILQKVILRVVDLGRGRCRYYISVGINPFIRVNMHLAISRFDIIL